MRRNTDASFIGVAALKRRHAAQVAEFEAWAARADWGRFHSSHYDWWAFPIDRPSSYGWAYVVCAGDAAELAADPTFAERFVRGVELVAGSMGWDLVARRPLGELQPGQGWHDWPVRLHKMARSARLLGSADAFDSLQTYALALIAQGKRFEFGGTDLAWLFRGEPDPHGPGCG